LHVALVCLPFASHITVFETLARELQRRGHRVSLLVNAGAEHRVSAGFDIHAIAGTDRQTIDGIIARASRPSGPLGILRTVHDTARLTDAFCRHAPTCLRGLGIDAILGDQMEPAAGLVARFLRLPLISIACALPIEREEAIPLPFVPWLYDPSEKGIRRNRGGERVARLLLTEQRRMIGKWSQRFGLEGTFDDLPSCLSDIATIAQTTTAFDFPRQASSARLAMVGPLRAGTQDAEIPFAVDPKRPFVFMSLGTLQGHRFRLFRAAARACRGLDAQLLVAHCGGLGAEQARAVGATWVVDFAPQRAVLARADLCITHGGMNTVMDALAAGTPMLALPIAFDQPGVSARIVHHGVGLRLSPRRVTTGGLRKAIGTLLREPGFAQRARSIGRSIPEAGGLLRAADIIEATLARTSPMDTKDG
jgi:zeaxanthin glucosyltransferase